MYTAVFLVAAPICYIGTGVDACRTIGALAGREAGRCDGSTNDVGRYRTPLCVRDRDEKGAFIIQPFLV